MSQKYKTSRREMYYHLTKPFIDTQGREFNGATVFFREETYGWCAEVAHHSRNDQFNRRVGRNVARRRYFQEKQAYDNLGYEPMPTSAIIGQPNYETALEVASVAGFWCDAASDYCAPTA